MSLTPTTPPIVDLAALPPEMARMIQNLVAEGERNHVLATAILQAAGNLIGSYAYTLPHLSEADIDDLCERFVRGIAVTVYASMEAQAAARLGGGLH